MATRTAPAANRSQGLEMKYGTTISTMPQSKGIIVRCFLP